MSEKDLFAAGEVLHMNMITPDMIGIMDEVIELEKEVHEEKNELREKINKLNNLRGLLKLQPYEPIPHDN